MNAGVSSFISFSNSDIVDFDPSDAPNTVVVNPPWEGRLVDADDSWTKLSEFLHSCQSDSTAWVRHLPFFGRETNDRRRFSREERSF